MRQAQEAKDNTMLKIQEQIQRLFEVEYFIMDPLPSDLGYEGAVFEAFPLLRFSLMKIVNHCHQFHKLRIDFFFELTDCIFAINVACRHVPLLCSNFCYSFLVMVVCYDSHRNFVVNLHFSNFISFLLLLLLLLLLLG